MWFPTQDMSICKVSRKLSTETKGYHSSNEPILDVNLDPSADQVIAEQQLSYSNMTRAQRLVLNSDLAPIDQSVDIDVLIETVRTAVHIIVPVCVSNTNSPGLSSRHFFLYTSSSISSAHTHLRRDQRAIEMGSETLSSLRNRAW